MAMSTSDYKYHPAEIYGGPDGSTKLSLPNPARIRNLDDDELRREPPSVEVCIEIQKRMETVNEDIWDAGYQAGREVTYDYTNYICVLVEYANARVQAEPGGWRYLHHAWMDDEPEPARYCPGADL